jgi:hypothetical protein
MNDHVFAYKGAPLRRLAFSTEDGKLRQTGVLDKAIDVRFTMTATPSLTDAGMIRIHPDRIRVLGAVGTKLMKVFDIDLDEVIDVSGARGVKVEGNDMLLDPSTLLPAPSMRGHITRLRVDSGALVQVFGGSTASPGPVPPDSAAVNYMLFVGGTLRFGKLSMAHADMLVVDADPSDPFDFSLGEYDSQLVAGWSSTLRDLGLEVFMPDLDDLRRGATGRRGARATASVIAPRRALPARTRGRRSRSS